VAHPQIDPARLELAVQRVLSHAQVRNALVDVAVLDDPAIWQVNREFLSHDYPTDVISFVHEQNEDGLEGEVLASWDTAVSHAATYGWPAADELLLYVIHGTLHLVGHDDQTAEALDTMRDAERAVLATFGLTPHYHGAAHVAGDAP
jgi:probable rRNA maturation factor